MVVGRPVSFSSARIAAIAFACPAWSPWLILTRKASAPARWSAAIVAGLALAGPRVAKMRTLRPRGVKLWTTIAPIACFYVTDELGMARGSRQDKIGRAHV